MEFKILFSLFLCLSLCNCVLAYVDPALLRTLRGRDGATTNILVSFDLNKIQFELKTISEVKFESRSDRISRVAQTLMQNTKSAQADVVDFLKNFNPPLKFESFWISNQLFIQSANLNLVQRMMTFAEITEIYEDEFITLDSPTKLQNSKNSDSGVEWNIARIEAPGAWNLGYFGEGVLVGSIDSGVLCNHSALRSNYVGPSAHGWYDPWHETTEPNDQNGHGTHVMGILAGSGGIGVAPKSKWMSCKGCYYDLCASSNLIKCGQFMLCPTLPDFSSPDCSKAPHVINCSWGGGWNNPAYHGVIDAWTAAGITPVFSNGNTGPACSTGRSPADYPKVIAVGATTEDDTLAEDSGLGPTTNGTIKPNLVAPGVGIRSATNTGDNDYDVMKGTSMAAPHVTGTIAILKSANQELGFSEILKILEAGAFQNLNLPGKNCGGIPETQFPNNAAGHGRVDALASLNFYLERTNIN